MNTRKQQIVEKTSEYYHSTGESAIILYEDKGLTAQEIKNIKKDLWSIGETMSIKNTLFVKFMEEHKIAASETLRGNNVAVFCKDAFQAIHCTNTTLKNLKIKKFQIKCAFINNSYFDLNAMKRLQRFNSADNLYADTFYTLQSPMIMLIKILTIAGANSDK